MASSRLANYDRFPYRFYFWDNYGICFRWREYFSSIRSDLWRTVRKPETMQTTFWNNWVAFKEMQGNMDALLKFVRHYERQGCDSSYLQDGDKFNSEDCDNFNLQDYDDFYWQENDNSSSQDYVDDVTSTSFHTSHGSDSAIEVSEEWLNVLIKNHEFRQKRDELKKAADFDKPSTSKDKFQNAADFDKPSTSKATLKQIHGARRSHNTSHKYQRDSQIFNTYQSTSSEDQEAIITPRLARLGLGDRASSKYTSSSSDGFHDHKHRFPTPKKSETIINEKELKGLYGENYKKINEMETSVLLIYNRFCHDYEPILWPAIPLNIAFNDNPNYD